jgi:uncharacterized protein (TIGR03435 family)
VGAGALQLLLARQPGPPPAAEGTSATAWRMAFDHPTGQMAIRGFTARDLVRYAYQLPTSRVIGGPAWLDSESFDLTTTVDHVPAADETPAIVRQLLEDRFALRVHEQMMEVPALALEIARPDGALGPNLQPAASDCFDQKAWVAAGAPRMPLGQGERTVICGVWDDGLNFEHVRGITMDELADSMRRRYAPILRLDVLNRTGLEGPFDVSLDYFRPAAVGVAVTPKMRFALRLAGFQPLSEVVETQLGLKLVQTTTEVPAIAIDEIQRPLREPLQF